MLIFTFSRGWAQIAELEETATKAGQLETDLTAEQQAGEEKAERITALTIENARLGEQVKAEKSGVQAMRNALDTANNERERDRATHEQDRGRWEKERERLQQALETERSARGEAEHQTAELRTENARLEERAGAADIRAGEMKGQLEDLQIKFADVAKAQKPKPTRKKAPAPKP